MKRKRGNWCRRKKRHCAGKKNRKQSWHIKKKENNEKLDDAKKKIQLHKRGETAREIAE